MKTNSKNQTGVKVVTAIKAGALSVNHSRRVQGLKVSTNIKAGEAILTLNHNRRLA